MVIVSVLHLLHSPGEAVANQTRLAAGLAATRIEGFFVLFFSQVKRFHWQF